MIVRNHMTINPITITADTTYPEATNLLRRHKIRRLPVVEHGTLIGIVVEKDLLSNQPSPASTLSVYEMYTLLEHLRVRQIMTHPVVTVEGDCPMEEAARIMIDRRIGCLPVMEGKNLLGIITETDIFKSLVEVLGGEESGTRLVVTVAEKVGELARVTACVAEAGGNILAITTSRVHTNQHREVTIRESGANPTLLKQILEKNNVSIVTMQTTVRYQPRLFG